MNALIQNLDEELHRQSMQECMVNVLSGNGNREDAGEKLAMFQQREAQHKSEAQGASERLRLAEQARKLAEEQARREGERARWRRTGWRGNRRRRRGVARRRRQQSMLRPMTRLERMASAQMPPPSSLLSVAASRMSR